MKQAAKTICKNGGRVLNIGFGLGIIDTFIQEEGVEEHWIVESNPTVLQKMKNDGKRQLCFRKSVFLQLI